MTAEHSPGCSRAEPVVCPRIVDHVDMVLTLGQIACVLSRLARGESGRKLFPIFSRQALRLAEVSSD